MKITNHKLDCKQIPSPNHSGTIFKPTLLVLHYTASGSNRDGDEKYFQNPSAKASAHIVVERDGEVTQCVDFNKKAWHAGRSVWKGKSNCNDYSIGIEIDNWGILTKTEDGKYRSWQGEKIDPSAVLSAKNKQGNHGYWETYPAKQLAAVEEVIDAILESYPSITEIVGHEDIAPGRKVDPGPALYDFIRKMNNKFYDDRRNEVPELGKTLEEKEQIVKKTVIASALRVRSRPDANAAIVGAVTEGKIVEVLYDGGDWAQIRWPAGWVYDKYLK